MKIKNIFMVCSLLVVLGVLTALWPKDLASKEEDRGPLSKITFIHYKKNQARGNGASRPRPTPVSSCYGFLSSGAKWKTIEPYLVNPNNLNGLSSDFIVDSMEMGVNEWEKYGGNIFGAVGVGFSAVYGVYDNKNSVQFGVYDDPQVIAVTSVWGYFSGPPKTRELVEWDMLFNEGSDWRWGDATVDSSLMDLTNIATHELGHSAGMDDLYETSCTAETMYGYSSEGEVSKRDLNAGDIVGIQKLY